MKYLILLLLLLFLFFGASCIQDEPLGMEADIEYFSFDPDIQVSISAPPYTSVNTINVLVTRDCNVKALSPQIEITSGATISPASGKVLDFSSPVQYVVTSEDGKWKKTYTVKVDTVSRILRYSFDQWELEQNAYPALVDKFWCSANQGIYVAKNGQIDDFPTRSTTDAFCADSVYDGNRAALLETQPGGTFFGVNITIFSASLFTGGFKLDASNPLNSARFGQIHPRAVGKPLELNGYYKYLPGKKMVSPEGELQETDQCNIYALLFKVSKGEAGKKEFLIGNEVSNSDKIVARAQLPDLNEKREYTRFSLPFVYAEQPDWEKWDYKLTIVFASSRQGDFYRGAAGSRLYVDDVSVICEDFKLQKQ